MGDQDILYYWMGNDIKRSYGHITEEIRNFILLEEAGWEQ